MLMTFLQWIYLSLLSLLTGYSAFRASLRLFQLRDPKLPDIPLLALFGFCSLGLLTEILSLLMPIDFGAHLIILLGAVFLFSSQGGEFLGYLRREFTRLREWHPLLWAAFVSAVLFSLVKATGAALNYDTGLYHAQNIRWLEGFGTVPGLGNLHHRLAYSSVWFPLVTFSSLSYLPTSSFHVAGSWLYLLAVMILLDRLSPLLKGHLRLSSILSLSLIIISRRLFSRELSSPGTDMPTALLFWVILLIWMLKWERDESWEPDAFAVLMLSLSFYALTLKPTALPILIVPGALFIAWILEGRRQLIWPASGIAILILFPWVARTVMLSGYVLFPFPYLDLFSFDWEIPRDQVLARLIGDRSWARNPGDVSSAILNQPLQEWLPQWFRVQAEFDQQLLLLTLTSIVAFFLTYWRVRRDKALRSKLSFDFWLPYLICGAGVGYWMYSAPHVRFGYPVLGFLLAICISPVITWGLRQIRISPRLIFTLALLGIGAIHLVSLYTSGPDAFRARWLVPTPYPRRPTEIRYIDGQDIRVPKKGDQCWDAEIPCTPRLDDDLVPRGDSLGDGYRTGCQ